VEILRILHGARGIGHKKAELAILVTYSHGSTFIAPIELSQIEQTPFSYWRIVTGKVRLLTFHPD